MSKKVLPNNKIYTCKCGQQLAIQEKYQLEAKEIAAHFSYSLLESGVPIRVCPKCGEKLYTGKYKTLEEIQAEQEYNESEQFVESYKNHSLYSQSFEGIQEQISHKIHRLQEKVSANTLYSSPVDTAVYNNSPMYNNYYYNNIATEQAHLEAATKGECFYTLSNNTKVIYDTAKHTWLRMMPTSTGSYSLDLLDSEDKRLLETVLYDMHVFRSPVSYPEHTTRNWEDSHDASHSQQDWQQQAFKSWMNRLDYPETKVSEINSSAFDTDELKSIDEIEVPKPFSEAPIDTDYQQMRLQFTQEIANRYGVKLSDETLESLAGGDIKPGLSIDKQQESVEDGERDAHTLSSQKSAENFGKNSASQANISSSNTRVVTTGTIKIGNGGFTMELNNGEVHDFHGDKKSGKRQKDNA